MAKVECRHSLRNFHTVKSAGWSVTCGGSRIKNRLINSCPGLASFEWITPRIACASLIILFAGILCLAQAQPLIIESDPCRVSVPFQLNPPLDPDRNFEGIRLAMNIKSGRSLMTPRVVAARYLNRSRKQ